MKLIYNEPKGSGGKAMHFLFQRPAWQFMLRVSFCYMLLGLFGMQMLSADPVHSQNLEEVKVMLEIRNEKLRSLFQKIEKQTRLQFAYNTRQIDAYRTTIPQGRYSVKEALEKGLEGTPLRYRQLDKSIIIYPVREPSRIGSHAEANDRPQREEEIVKPVRGKVTDEKGDALPGVSILIKGTSFGTTTDGDGVFSLEIPDESAVLVFSFVGYRSLEVAPGSRTFLDVSLVVDEKALDEVIVVGYGVQSKRNVTGSVSKVNMKQTQDLPNTNVGQSLRGRVAGVQFLDNGRPGQSGSILVRGPRSLSGGNNPLIVLDGIFFNGNLADINPNDIESMEVLKDASSAAIYGSRAANGVILITSKKGATEKPTIRVNAFTGLSNWSYKPKLLTAERYIKKTLDIRKQTGLEADPAKIRDYLTTSELVNYDAGKTVDPYDEISQQGRISSYDLSLSGKSDRTNYFLSTSLSDERGLIYNDNMKRLAIRTNIENNVFSWLSIGMNANYIRRDLSGREASLGSAYYATPFGTWYHEDGEPTWFVIAEDQIPSNSMRDAILTKNQEIFNNLFTNFYALVDIPFIKGLSYRLNYSPNYRWQHNYNFVRQDKHEMHINNTSASKMNRQDFDWVMENILTYSRQVGQHHFFDVTLLYGRNHAGWESTQANSTRLSSDALGWNNLGVGELLTNTSDAQSSDGISSMFRVNYRFMDRYIATLTMRRDGSSVFAANNKYASFPSMAFAWIASDEQFLENVNSLNLLKLRLSYGAVGNQAISPYQSLSLSSTNRFVFGDGGASSLGVFPSNMANTSLKWETTFTTNAAIDFELFKSRLGGTFEVYNMNTRDLLVRRSLPNMTGYEFVWTNLGATNNKGLELSLNTTNISRRHFEWSTNFVFSRNKNKIVHLYRSDTNNDGREDDDLGNRWFIGQPINVAFDYVFDGIYQQGDEMPTGYTAGFVRLKDLNNDGKIDAADRQTLGQTGQPKYRWGITNTFRYKDWTLAVFVNAMQGWMESIRNADYSVSGENYPHRPLNMLDVDWWTEENKSNTRPSMVYPNPFGHGYYYSRDFIRIQDVSLTYDLPKNALGKLRLANLRFFLTGKNLCTFTKWIGPDPESGQTNRGSFFPTARSVAFGFNAGF